MYNCIVFSPYIYGHAKLITMYLKNIYLSFSSNSEVNASGLLEDSSLLTVDMHHGQMAVEFAFEISRLQSVNTTQIYC